MKWLRFYLDFCEKYKHSPTHPDNSNAFMKKLTEKGQTPAKQRQAAQSIRVYLDIIKQQYSDHPIVTEKGVYTTTNSVQKGLSDIFDLRRLDRKI